MIIKNKNLFILLHPVHRMELGSCISRGMRQLQSVILEPKCPVDACTNNLDSMSSNEY